MNSRLIVKLHKRPTPVESPVMAVVELVGVVVVLGVLSVGIACLLMPIRGLV